MEQTMRSVLTQLPSTQNINIIVDDLPAVRIDSLPTKQKIVWRQLVDMEKVAGALKWLCANNHLYDGVKISALGIDSFDLATVPEEDESISQLVDDSQLSMLDHLPRDTIYTESTVQEMDTPLPIETDTELFQQRSIESASIFDSDPLLDLLCFPEIYCDGLNGLHSKREIPLPSYLFYRHRFSLNDPSVRRNMPYLFHVLHMKDRAAMDSGIYACLKTGYGSGIRAIDLLTNLGNNDKMLEGNLNMVRSKIAGTVFDYNFLC
jgi:hypothetical protein